LAVALVLILVTVVAGLRSEASGLAERFPEQGPTLLILALVAGLLAALGGAVATRRRGHLLLGRAGSRPGQLGRGRPLRRPLLGGGAAALVAAVLLIYLRSRRVRTIARRTRAAEWIGPTPQVEEPPAV